MADHSRADHLNQPFPALISDEECSRFVTTRWQTLRLAVPMTMTLATHDRPRLVEKARGLSALQVDETGKDGLMSMLDMLQEVSEFSAALLETADALQARLLLVADDLLLEAGQESAFEPDPPFNADSWIKRASDAGMTLFVRDDELWIGTVAADGKSEEVDRLKAELAEGDREAVRKALSARSLECAEA